MTKPLSLKSMAQEMWDILKDSKTVDCGCGWLMPEEAADRVRADLESGAVLPDSMMDFAKYGGVFCPCPEHAKKLRELKNDHT